VNLFAIAHACLACVDPAEKVRLTLDAASRAQTFDRDPAGCAPPAAVPVAGRPARPRLVHPRELAQRKLTTAEGRAALVHAVAHIELNAINLAWDAVYRFRDLPDAYYDDWVGVAADEARHFAMLEARLRELGHEYGDFDAHDGLWDMAVKTAGSCLERMALVPRVLEARGLDVTPGMIERLERAGDRATADQLRVILHEEVAHVACGSRWFRHCCELAGVDPVARFRELVTAAGVQSLRGPLNREARLRAGFSGAELDAFAQG
jgi:uncharacterized ferritin-like protein (DUF455 family)